MRLLHLDPESVKKLLDDMEDECNSIRENSIRMAWYMRGGLSYTDAMNLSNAERAVVSKLIEENLETTKKTKMPFF